MRQDSTLPFQCANMARVGSSGLSLLCMRRLRGLSRVCMQRVSFPFFSMLQQQQKKNNRNFPEMTVYFEFKSSAFRSTECRYDFSQRQQWQRWLSSGYLDEKLWQVNDVLSDVACHHRASKQAPGEIAIKSTVQEKKEVAEMVSTSREMRI